MTIQEWWIYRLNLKIIIHILVHVQIVKQLSTIHVSLFGLRAQHLETLGWWKQVLAIQMKLILHSIYNIKAWYLTWTHLMDLFNCFQILFKITLFNTILALLLQHSKIEHHIKILLVIDFPRMELKVNCK